MRRTTVAPILGLVMLLPLVSGCLSGGDESSTKSTELVKIQAEGKVTGVYPGTYKFDGAFSQVLAPGLLKSLPPVHTFIKSKIDNQDIEIGYWVPDVPEGTKVPVLIHASPYHRPAGSVTRLSGMKLFLHDNFLPHGYAVAAVAVRGTADSGGCMDLMGKKENGDLDQAVTWLATQPWASGAAAMIGVSYDGSTPWTVASFGNPYLKTIVPISGVPDLYGLMYRNGSSETRGPVVLNNLYYEYGFGPSDPNRSADKRITGLACPESLEGLAWSAYSGIYGERDPRGWWQERNRKPAVEKNYKGSVLSVQGLQDWNVDPHMVIPWADQLNQSGIYVKQMLGQWGHMSPDRRGQNAQPMPYTRYDWAEILLHWFDYWLKDQKTLDLGPSVQVQDHTFQWRNEKFFPPHDAAWTTYHLSGGNRLAPQAGAAGSVILLPTPLVDSAGGSFRSVPGYSADFATGQLQEDLRLSGLPRLHVTVSPKGPTGHLAAWLYDVDETGKETRVGWTMINLLYADGTEKAKPFTPNTPILAKMEFQPLDAFIKAGHQLRVRVWEYREADRLPAVPPEPVELLYGGSVKSVLELPIITRAPDDYFLPPMPAK